MADDSNKTSYSLIKGVFPPDQANHLLMTLIQDKLSFHQRNNWSRRERFGESEPEGTKRMEELRQTKADLTALIEKAAGEGMELNINCDIEITLSPQ
ncbi:MAG: hypothetical protein R3E50_01680 [Halioglobus sp.]